MTFYMFIKHTMTCLLFLIFILGMRGILMGKVVTVRSDEKFENALLKKCYTRDCYAVVMFYREDKQTKSDRALRERINRMEEVFHAVSESDFYKESSLKFIKINITKSSLNDLIKQYGINRLPAFLLFENSVPIREKDITIKLEGFVSSEVLKNFIDNNISTELEDVIKEKEKIRKRRLEEERLRSYYYGPYWYYGGYPYWYGYPYYPYWGWRWYW